MRKKFTRIIENSLPYLCDKNGNQIDRRKLANKIFDALPYSERLFLLPFEKYIPFACSGCSYNDANRLGCTYGLFSEDKHHETPAPDDCPLEY